MNGFIVTGKGRLTRNPMTVTAADSDFAKICLMNADAFYVDCDHDDRPADEFQTDADRMHDAIGDDFSAIVIPADLPRTCVG